MIIAVAGLPGAGKTTWIRQQLIRRSMKLAVISCIHGNYEALDAVLLDIDRQNADKIFCVGDLVGYGPYPNAVVEQIRSLDIPTCQGCWDEDVVGNQVQYHSVVHG